jgi:L-threonylcarbamoyladenylate synthase
MNDPYTKITNALSDGGVAVVRSDTVYGIVALAANEAAVEKVYDVKHRSLEKQCIILHSENSFSKLKYADLIKKYSQQAATPTTIIVPATHEPAWILRGGNTIAYRVVHEPFLSSVIDAVGPVIAPSANPEGLAPARSIQEARNYFGQNVECYIDGGIVPEFVHPSTILQLSESGEVTVIRGSIG